MAMCFPVIAQTVRCYFGTRNISSSCQLISIKYDSAGGKGRGYFASQPIPAGKLILYEECIAAESLDQLTRLIISSELNDWLYTPDLYSIHPPPSDLRGHVEERNWSKCFAQATANG